MTQVLIGVFVSYVSVAELKDWMSGGFASGNVADTVDDANLLRAAKSASEAVDAYCGRSFAMAVDGEGDPVPSVRILRADRCDVLYTPDIGDDTGLVVATDNAGNGTFSTTWAAGDIQAEPNFIGTRPITCLRAIGSKSFPVFDNSRYGVKVTAAWGWPAVPDSVVQATLILASRLFRRKGTPEGIASFAELGLVRVSKTDVDVTSLLNPLVKRRVG